MITHSVTLPLDQAAAFALFTDRISEWWPPERRHTQDPSSRITLAKDAPFAERAADGTEALLGRVTLWEPPDRIRLDFYLGTGPERPTDVSIVFEPVPGGTRVTVRHGATEASAGVWDATAPRFATSWEIVLRALTHAAAAG